MNNTRILIVEDESLVAEDLENSLTRAGYQVVGVADNYDEAARLATEKSPDLALLDIRLKGGRDGIDLADTLRQRDIGYIYLTSHSDEGTLQRAERTEPLGYVLKPFGTRELTPVLRTAIYRQSAERRHRGMEDWLRTVLRCIGDGVIVVDADARVTYANPEALRLSGRSLREVSGMPAAEVLRIVDAPSHEVLPCVVTRCMQARATTYLADDVELVRGDGTRVPVEDSAAPIMAADGRLLGAVVVIRNATQRRLVEQRRREAENRIRSAEKLTSVSVLASSLAHDINNLMTSILGNTTLARDGATEDLTSRLDEIAQCATDAADLCRRMLLRSGTGPLERESLPLDALVAQCIATERVLWPGSVAITSELQGSGLVLHADPVQTRQMLQNLLRNACEALAPTGGRLIVRAGSIRLPTPMLAGRRKVEALAPGSYVWIEVADDGPGMTDEVRARALEPFFTTKSHGTGLGLANANAITLRHGGTMEIEAEAGVGTVIRVFWPQAEGDPAVPSGSAVLPGRATKPLVLVVDDQPQVRDVTCRLLDSRNWRGEPIANGERLLARLGEGPRCDAIVLDVHLPDLSLDEVLARARALQPDVPILLVSGASAPPTPLPQDACTGFLAKPFLVEELIERLWRLLRSSS